MPILIAPIQPLAPLRLDTPEGSTARHEDFQLWARGIRPLLTSRALDLAELDAPVRRGIYTLDSVDMMELERYMLFECPLPLPPGASPLTVERSLDVCLYCGETHGNQQKCTRRASTLQWAYRRAWYEDTKGKAWDDHKRKLLITREEDERRGVWRANATARAHAAEEAAEHGGEALAAVEDTVNTTELLQVNVSAAMLPIVSPRESELEIALERLAKERDQAREDVKAITVRVGELVRDAMQQAGKDAGPLVEPFLRGHVPPIPATNSLSFSQIVNAITRPIEDPGDVMAAAHRFIVLVEGYGSIERVDKMLAQAVKERLEKELPDMLELVRWLKGQRERAEEVIETLGGLALAVAEVGFMREV